MGGINLNSNNQANTRLVEKYINTAYDKVKAVSENLAVIEAVADNVAGFSGVYYGALSVEPTTRNDGSAMQQGDMYFNSTSQLILVRKVTSWVGFVSFTTTVELKTIVAGDIVSGDTVISLSIPYETGTNSILVYVNGFYKTNTNIANVAGNYTETNSTTLTFPGVVLDVDTEVLVVARAVADTTDNAFTIYNMASILENSWVSAITPRGLPNYYKDSQNVVHLEGSITAGVVTLGTAVATLPANFRPIGGSQTFIVSNNTNTAILGISTTGVITIIAIDNNTDLSFNGISFRT